MGKKLRKSIRKFLRAGLKKAYLYLSIFSIILNTSTPFLLTYKYVVYAQDALQSSDSASIVDTMPADSVVTSDNTTAAQDNPIIDAPVVEIPEVDQEVIETTPSDTSTSNASATETTQSVGDILSTGATDYRPDDTALVTAPDPTAPAVAGANTQTFISGDEKISTKVLDNTNATSVDEVVDALNLTPEQIQKTNGSLITDKADYAPTDTAIITGMGFEPNKTLKIEIVSTLDLKFSDTFKTDDAGGFIYTYQLDGTYRPLYTVYVKDGKDVLAKMTFTDSPPSGCLIDAEGANDQPGQKDLTKLCADYTSFPTSFGANWNWDEIGWTGSNTGDACAIFDTNGNGFADYALCVTVHNTPAVYSTKTLYSCGDNRSDRCTSAAIQTASSSTTCTAGVTSGADPFSAGEAYDKDTVAQCTIQTSDVGGGAALFLDVCSYPAANPNSDPSDCIVASTASQTGKLEIVKNLVPTSDGGLFNLSIDSNVYAYDATNNGTTGEKIVDTGSHTFAEAAGTGTTLSDYTASVVCKDANGTGSVVSTTGSGPWSLTIAKDADVVCTITNTLNTGTLIVKKVVTNDNGGAKEASDFSFSVNGGSAVAFESDGQNDLTVNAGTYSVTESSAFGYDTTYDNCSSVVVTNGGTATCTITNNDKPASLKIIKHVIIDNNGSKSAGDFTMLVNATSPSQASFAGSEDGTDITLNAGYYSVDEDSHDGYTKTLGANCSGTIANGESKTCTITNDDIAPELTLVKTVVNNYGGTKKVSDFILKINNTEVLSGQTSALSVGSYTASEVNLTGYTASDWGGDCAADGSITLSEGDAKTCTITNSDIQPQLIVIKHVDNLNGGDKLASDFTMNVTGTDVSPSSFEGEELGTNVGLDAGSYSVGETGPSGYISNYSTDCSGTINIGETKTCTFTNGDQPGTIHIIKHVVKNYGGNAQAGDFTMLVSGTSQSATNFDGAEAGVSVTVSAGQYSVDEGSHDGYAKILSADCSGTIANGESKTCTITNSDIQPKLTVTKVVVGSTTPVSSFPLFVDQTQVTSGVQSGFGQGTYTVSETSQTGYTEAISGNCAEDGSITLSVGDVKSCTITNTRDTGTVQVKKVVDPSDDSLWDINVSGPTNNSDTLADGEQTDVFTSDTGNYDISETGHDGTNGSDYNSSYVCKIGEEIVTSGNGTEINDLTLEKNKNVVCTFTNAIKRGSVTIIKDAQPNDPQDFNFTGNLGPFYLDDDGDNSNTLSNTKTYSELVPGTYTVTEPNTKDWTLDSVDCTGGSDTDTHAKNAVIKLKAGEDVTCTFTNSINRGSVEVTKYLDDNANGLLDNTEITLPDWEIHLGESSQFTNSEGVVTFSDILPGSYPLSELLQNDWTQSNISCTGDEGIDISNNHTVTVNPGDTILCEIGNYQNANIKVVKRVLNSEGTEVTDTSTNFGFTVGNESFTLTDDQDHSVSVKPGTYDVTETPDDRYTFNGCTAEYGDESVGEPIQNGKRVTVNSGDVVTVTCENLQLPDPVLTISKTNNHLSDPLHVGDDVLYTITLDISDAAMKDVIVTDLLPIGFSFDPLHWSATINGNPLSIATPTYHSPGQWGLGDLQNGDHVVLQYTVHITNDVDSGTYKDLVWAKGNNIADDEILSIPADNSPEHGYINDPNFVGTQVKVLAGATPEVSAKVKENITQKEEVLGASTSLPATGANTDWLIAALILTIGGFAMFIYGIVSKKKTASAPKTLTILLLMAALGLIGPKTFASVSPLRVRVEDPYSNQTGAFKVTFVTLDTVGGREITAKCYVQKPSDGSYESTPFNIIDISAGGNTSNCDVISGILTEQGNYRFKVDVTAGSDSASAETGLVTFDNQGPEKPRSITKDKQSSCLYKITIKTASDGQTSYVEVYRDDDTDIQVNDESRVKTLTMGPNEEQSFDDTLSGSCKKPYYAVRAFDVSENASDVRTEVIETTHTTTTVDNGTKVTQGAIPVTNGLILGAGTTSSQNQTGSVLGESSQSSTTAPTDNAGVTKNITKEWWFWILIIFGIMFGVKIASKKK